MAFSLTKQPQYLRVTEEITEYLVRDLRHPLGAFFSAEDADSYPVGEEGKAKKEGAFCVWDLKEVKDLLGDHKVDGLDITLADVVIDHYNMKEDGNVNPLGDPHGELKGKNVLSLLPEKPSVIK